MAKKKPKDDADRHKPRYMVGLPAELGELLKVVADQRYTKPSQEVVRAVCELLEREGLWPPKKT